jgi:hypothetical protein
LGPSHHRLLSVTTTGTMHVFSLINQAIR